MNFHLADNGVYTVIADKTEAGIDLTLHLKDDSTMSIEKIEGVKKNESPGKAGSPQTGNTSNIFLWITLLLVSGMWLLATMVYQRKNSNKTST